jgi:dimeric dUTPase (all-alpha-NTP-PPase superfamily)
MSAMDILKSSMDKYLIEKFASLFRSLAEFTKQLTKNPLMHSDFIVSGIAKKSLRFLFF